MKPKGMSDQNGIPLFFFFDVLDAKGGDFLILIIAEKPSLGRNIAAGIGQMQNRQGYLEGNGYLITWAFGHLFSLCDIETYRPSPDFHN